jgi:hypothetical protein
LWEVAHENGHKHKNNEFFCHPSQKCTECHGPCKSPQNPKTMCNSSWTQP